MVLACGTIVVNVASLVALVTLLIWSSSGILSDLEYNDEGKWEFDEEDRAGVKLLVNLTYLIAAGLTLFSPAWKVWGPNGVMSRVSLGALAGSVFMFANMMFVSFFYFMNFEAREEDENNDDDNNNNNNNNDDDQEMDREDLINYQSFVVSKVCLALALAFGVLSWFLFCEGIALPEAALGTAASEVERARGAAHLEILLDAWSFLSGTTVVVLMIVFFAALAPLFMEDAERAKEEGLVFNIIIISALLVCMSVCFLFAGKQVLGEKKRGGSLGVGALSGALTYFAALLFMIFFLYANFSFEERHREDEFGSSVAASFTCFFLSLLHLSFALVTNKYRNSIVGAIPGEEQIVTEDNGTGDFVRLDKLESETAHDYIKHIQEYNTGSAENTWR